MFKRAGSYAFFMAVYLSGIVIGLVYTPDVVGYAKQISAQKSTDQIQKPPQLKKKKTKSRQTVGLG